MDPNKQHERASGDTGQGVIGLLRRQRDLYRQLRSLAERQRGLVARNDAADLLSVLGDRQKVVQALAHLGRDLAPHREDWDQTREELGAEDREEADRILVEVRTILEEVISADERDARMLSARRTQNARALHGVHGDRRAVTAYAAGSATHRGIERLSEES